MKATPVLMDTIYTTSTFGMTTVKLEPLFLTSPPHPLRMS